MVLILLNNGSNANTIDNEGDTPLYWMLKNKNDNNFIEVIRILINYNVSSTFQNTQKNNALHILVSLIIVVIISS
jgi:ankyrin repeat protein